MTLLVKEPKIATEVPKQPFVASAELAAQLAKIGKVREVPVGTVLFRNGDASAGVYLVLNGRFALWSGDDHVRVTRIAERDSLLGLPATVRERPYSLSAEAVTEATVCLVEPAAFTALMMSSTGIGLEVVRLLADEISALRKLAVYES